jgi:hypothetical protein
MYPDFTFVGFKHLEWKIGHLQDSSAAMDATAGDVGARGYSKRDAVGKIVVTIYQQSSTTEELEASRLPYAIIRIGSSNG